MLGRLLRQRTKKLRIIISRRIVCTGISPNALTLFSLLVCLLAFWTIILKSYAFAIVLIIISSGIDTLDGTLAELLNKKSLFGDYFDALIDRYREMIFFCGFALSGFCLEAFFAATGSMLISYAKARTALTISINDDDWPAIGEMLDRISLLIIGMTIAIFLPQILNFSTISLTLWFIALITNIGAIQRIFYAKNLISKYQPK